MSQRPRRLHALPELADVDRPGTRRHIEQASECGVTGERSQISITADVYIHVTTEQQREAVSLVGKTLAGPPSA